MYHMKSHLNDLSIREGVEYSQALWDLRVSMLKLKALEKEYTVSIIVHDKNEFHRRVTENDKPGRRHMLPFYWSKRTGFSGETIEVKVPITFGSPVYEKRMAEFARRISEARRA